MLDKVETDERLSHKANVVGQTFERKGILGLTGNTFEPCDPHYPREINSYKGRKFTSGLPTARFGDNGWAFLSLVRQPRFRWHVIKP